jgi:peptidoglycan hydrolase-like protein with peptidoglycan-binding domain
MDFLLRRVAMKKMLTAACALTLGVLWAAGPAWTADTTASDKPTTGEKVKEKATEAKDTVKEKATEAKDKTQSAMEKVKDKAVEMKDKVASKMHRGKGRMAASDVTATQQALRDKGYDPGPIDGVWGPKTAKAVRDYQKAEGLTVTGRMDTATADRLGVKTSMSQTASPASPPTSTDSGASKSTPTTEEKKQNP